MEFFGNSEWSLKMPPSLKSDSMRSTLRRLAAETRGAEIAEAAAVLPLMFMMLLGIFWFGQAFSTYGAITRAAQEGARAGAVPYCATCSTTNNLAVFATNAVIGTNAALTASKLDPTLAQYPSSPPVFASCVNGGGGPPGCSTASTNICVEAPVQLTTAASAATPVCGMAVTFRYPFQFWLPFTSLNNQQIWLNAAARVRMEAH
jgi:Flp pilus assembly protein TadG